MRIDSKFLIEKLDLRAHPEGGYFRETFRSEEGIEQTALPERFDGDRNFAASIYFLLESGQKSRLHVLKQDEVWYYHAGCPTKIFIFTKDGEFVEETLGDFASENPRFQVVVPVGAAFGAYPTEPDTYSLCGCATAPAFDFADFKFADAEELLARFPDRAEIINMLK